MSVTSQSMSGVQEHRIHRVSRVAVVPLANSITAVALAWYLICAVLAALAPDLLFWLTSPWFHALSVEPLRAETWFQPGEFVAGVITFGVSAWLTGAAFGWLYNIWSRR